MIEIDGWILVRTNGSHRQYKHPSKRGIATIAENQNRDVVPRTSWSYEQTYSGWSGTYADLPGGVAAGKTRKETEDLIREAISFHLKGLREADELIPEPGSWTETVEVAI